ncbi:hypothetical protein RRG08_044764 [Elysia crispata]|uniref:Uncharacterized protein n=1 Tax=Elysia crispata TaxID=231223 RepID=A0AAE0ZHL7_9GAST|nr:hypothetical protein RRG08_044764 [Elysia crispata]
MKSIQLNCSEISANVCHGASVSPFRKPSPHLRLLRVTSGGYHEESAGPFSSSTSFF